VRDNALMAATPHRPGHGRLSVIQQGELAECGLACLAMVARYHGHDVDLAGLRRRFPVSLKGVGLARLIEIGDRMGFESRPLRTEPELLAGLQVPCLLHWDLNHFVVLKRADRRGIEIHDPAHGAVRMSLEEAGRHFTGIALELTPVADFTPMRERGGVRPTLRALAGRIAGLRTAVAQVLLLALALEVFTLALPLALQWVIDQVLVSADYGLLTLIGIGFLAVVLFQALTAAMRGWLVADIGASLGAQGIGQLFGHPIRLPLDYFEKRHVGGVLSRFTSVQAIQQTLTGSFIEALLDGLTVVLVLALLLFYSVPLTGLVLAVFALYAALRWL